MICDGCPSPTPYNEKQIFEHFHASHDAYIRLRAAVKQAALNAGPGGWPKITDWVEVKKLADAREPWTPNPR